MALSLFANILFFVLFSYQNNYSDKVIGVWLNEEKEGKIEIYKQGEKYFGKIVWIDKVNYVNNQPPKDSKNPDSKLRSRTVEGIEILKNFSYEPDDKEWINGTIYDPKNGSTYSCYMWFEKNNFQRLYIRGYIGFSLIGRTTQWTKTDL
jgi:uncharacterized protein (DUF2147 family)